MLLDNVPSFHIIAIKFSLPILMVKSWIQSLLSFFSFNYWADGWAGGQEYAVGLMGRAGGQTDR